MKKISEIDIFVVNGINYAINYLNGACDAISDEIVEALNSEKFEKLSSSEISLLKERGYIFETEAVYEDYINKLNTTLREQDIKTYPNFVIIPSYECNLACSYCFEKDYSILEKRDVCSDQELMFDFIDSVVDKFKKSIGERKFNSQEVIITLMGGEPILKKNYSHIYRLIEKAASRGYSYNIITNGVEINEFIEVFKQFKPLAIQITLDGTKDIHDKRRYKKDRTGTFDKIIKNVHALLENQICVQIRVNIDNENISNIKDFSDFMKKEFGDTKHLSAYIYPIQDGGCIYESNILSEENIIENIIRLASQGERLENIRKVFHGSSLFESIKYNVPLQLRLKNCAAFKKQYILDTYNNVYKCWYGVGDNSKSIGNLKENGDKLALMDQEWQSRDITSMEKCSKCKYRYICGTGCLSHIYRSVEDLKTPRCLDYKSLLEEQLKLMLYSMGY